MAIKETDMLPQTLGRAWTDIAGGGNNLCGQCDGCGLRGGKGTRTSWHWRIHCGRWQHSQGGGPGEQVSLPHTVIQWVK